MRRRGASRRTGPSPETNRQTLQTIAPGRARTRAAFLRRAGQRLRKTHFHFRREKNVIQASYLFRRAGILPIVFGKVNANKKNLYAWGSGAWIARSWAAEASVKSVRQSCRAGV